jgi:hypothetical protein
MASIDLEAELRRALVAAAPKLRTLIAEAVVEALAQMPARPADLDREVSCLEAAYLVGLSVQAFRKQEARGRWRRLPGRGRSVRFRVRDLIG